MLSFASAAFKPDKTLVSIVFSANLETPDDGVADLKTAEWWKSQPVDAWAACRNRSLRRPEKAMADYVNWIRGLAGKPSTLSPPIRRASTSRSSIGT